MKNQKTEASSQIENPQTKRYCPHTVKKVFQAYKAKTFRDAKVHKNRPSVIQLEQKRKLRQAISLKIQEMEMAKKAKEL